MIADISQNGMNGFDSALRHAVFSQAIKGAISTENASQRP
jgi:hypothetical protein